MLTMIHTNTHKYFFKPKSLRIMVPPAIQYLLPGDNRTCPVTTNGYHLTVGHTVTRLEIWVKIDLCVSVA